MRLKVTMLFLCVVCGSLRAQCVDSNTVFKSGERVYYDAFYNWGFIWLNAGDVLFSVDRVKKDKDEVYRFSSVGTTKPRYDRFYRVRDTFVVYVDTLKLKPIEYIQVTNEGSYSARHHYWFDRHNKTIKTHIVRDRSRLEESFIDWQECTFDLLSMIYQARNIDFSSYQPNDKIPISMIVDGEIHDLYIRYHGEEVATTRDGRSFRCLKFSPRLVPGTIFESGDGMTVWVTNDANRIPILVEAKILVGSVKAFFRQAEGLRHSMDAEILK